MAGHLRQRAPGVWEAIVSLPTDTLTGRQRQLSRTIRGGRREAQRALNALLIEAQDGRPSHTNATVAHLIGTYLDHAAGNLSPTTLRNYRGMAERYIAPSIGSKRLSKLTTHHLDALYLALLRERELAPATVRQVHALLRKTLNQAVRWAWIPTNPAVNATPPRVRHAPPTPPDPSQVLAVIAAAEDYDPDFACFLRLAAATGARRGELTALRWRDLSPDYSAVLIEHNVVEVSGGILLKDTKTHAARRIALDADTAAVLAKHRARVALRAPLTDEDPTRPDAFLFSFDLNCSRPWVPDHATKAFQTIKRRTRSSFRLHDLRHFAATRLLAAGVPVRTVSGRLGHANAATTLSVYAHFLAESDQDAARVMEQLLRPSSPS